MHSTCITVTRSSKIAVRCIPSSSRTMVDSPPLVQPWAPPLARPDGTSLSMIDKISSVDVAYSVSRAALLPLDMDREKNNSYDSLMKSIFQSSAKIMQKASVGLERAKDAEKELKKEQKRAQRVEKENAQYALPSYSPSRA